MLLDFTQWTYLITFFRKSYQGLDDQPPWRESEKKKDEVRESRVGSTNDAMIQKELGVIYPGQELYEETYVDVGKESRNVRDVGKREVGEEKEGFGLSQCYRNSYPMGSQDLHGRLVYLCIQRNSMEYCAHI